MPETESNDSTVGDLLATFVQAADPMLAADLRAVAQHPAAPETETDASGKVSLTEAEKKSLIPHAGDWAGFYAAIERIVAERVRVVEGERDEWKSRAFAAVARAESAEAAHEAEKAAHERLRAGIWALGESIHGDEGVVRREEGAKVLREAAEALDTEEAAIDTALIGVDYVIQRLRDRAASVGRGEGP